MRWGGDNFNASLCYAFSSTTCGFWLAKKRIPILAIKVLLTMSKSVKLTAAIVSLFLPSHHLPQQLRTFKM
ncbi:MAG TPA: hypothetical protein ACHBX0_14380 [Arsenophonus sp.]